MTIRHLMLPFLAAMLLWPAAALGQSPELMDAFNRYSDLSAQGKHAEAISFAKEALRLGEKEFGSGDPTTAIIINDLALLYMAQGRYAEAEPLHKRALSIRENALKPEPADIAESLNNLAVVYHELGRYAMAWLFSKYCLTANARSRLRRKLKSSSPSKSVWPLMDMIRSRRSDICSAPPSSSRSCMEPELMA